MSHPGALSTSIMVSYSALTTGWIGALSFFALKKDNAEDDPQAMRDTSEAARAQRLVTERYGVSLSKQDARTGKWWIVTDTGMILASGDTEDDAWIHSAFIDIEQPCMVALTMK